jgi:hypothetical protein
VEKTLRAAPKPKPQMPNLNALKMRGVAQGPMPPNPRSPQEQAELQQMYQTYMPLPDAARGGTRDMAPRAPAPAPQGPAWDTVAPAPPSPAHIPTLIEQQQRQRFLQGGAPQGDAVVPPPPGGAMPALAPGRVRHWSDVHWYDPEKPIGA